MDDQTWDHQVPLAGTGTIDDDKSDKILEIDTGNPTLLPSVEISFTLLTFPCQISIAIVSQLQKTRQPIKLFQVPHLVKFNL
jgi:hypothetical protein